jgi:hypothetical protein
MHRAVGVYVGGVQNVPFPSLSWRNFEILHVLHGKDGAMATWSSRLNLACKVGPLTKYLEVPNGLLICGMFKWEHSPLVEAGEISRFLHIGQRRHGDTATGSSGANSAYNSTLYTQY